MLFTLTSILAFAACGICTQSSVHRFHNRALPRHLPARGIIHRSTTVERRSESSELFDIGFQAQDVSLFSGTWPFEPPAVPLGPGFEVGLENEVSFSVNCVDCRTFGKILADVNSDDGFGIVLTFQNVGAHIELGVSASNTLTVTLTLGKFINPNITLASGQFAANIGLGLNLVLSLTAAADLTGGFELCIPDGAQLGFNIDIDADLTNGLVADSEIKTLPGITFSPLPFAISGSANATAALVLKTEASIEAEIGPVQGNAGAGAELTLVQVRFGASGSTDSNPGQCNRALFIDVESSAGAFAEAGLAISDQELLEDSPGVSVSTVFFTAGTTSCLGAAPPTILPLPPAAPSPSAEPGNDPGACPSAPIIETVTSTVTNSITSCLVPLINCPASAAKVVVITDVETLTATRCGSNPLKKRTPPLSSTISFHTIIATTKHAVGGGGYITTLPSSTTATTITLTKSPHYTAALLAPTTSTKQGTIIPTTSAIPVPFPVSGNYTNGTIPAATCGAGIALTSLESPLVVPVPSQFANVTVPANATAITGVVREVPAPTSVGFSLPVVTARAANGRDEELAFRPGVALFGIILWALML